MRRVLFALVVVLFTAPLFPARAQTVVGEAPHRGTYAITYSDTLEPQQISQAEQLLRATEAQLLPALDAEWFRAGTTDARPSFILNITVVPVEGEDPERGVFDLFAELRFVDGSVEPQEFSAQFMVDRAGRHLFPAPWRRITEELSAALEAQDPRVTLTVSAPRGTNLTLTTPTGRVLADDLVVDERGYMELRVRTNQRITVTAESARFRRETIPIEIGPMDVELPFLPYRYPRHTMGLTLRELSFPEVEYTFFDRAVRWHMATSVTFHQIGITPLQALNRSRDTASLITSHPLTRADLVGGWLSGNRDTPLRFVVQAGGFMRLYHRDDGVILDPILPGGATARVGVEFEMGRRLTFTGTLGGDLYVDVDEMFVPQQLFFREMGPFYGQIGVFRAGVRVHL